MHARAPGRPHRLRRDRPRAEREGATSCRASATQATGSTARSRGARCPTDGRAARPSSEVALRARSSALVDRRRCSRPRSAGWRGCSASSTAGERRRLNANPMPRLGGIAIFFGIFVPALAFLDARRRDARHPARRGGRDRRRRDRRLPRARAGGGSSAGRSSRPRSRRIFGVWIDRFTFPFVGVLDLPAGGRRAADDRLDRRGDEHGQLPRRPGRPRRRRLRDRRRSRSP